MMPFNHLILCRPLLLRPLIFPSIRVFSNELALRIRWAKYWNFSFSNSPSIEYSALVSLGLTGLMTNVPLVKVMVFPIFMYRCESWAIKLSAKELMLCVVLEKTLESPLDCKEIKPVHPKGNQSWIFIERTDAKAETPILWPPDVKNWLTGKDPNAGKY